MMDTIIKDACGLKPNRSTIKDLKLLLNFIKENEELTKILSYPQIIFKNSTFQNTNELHKHCLGKTGSFNGGYCFAGLYQAKPVICLNFITQKSLFNFIEDWIRLETKKVKKV